MFFLGYLIADVFRGINSSYPVVSLVPLFVPETNNNYLLNNNKKNTLELQNGN